MFGALRGQHGAFPLPPCGKATKGCMIKVGTILDRALAPCGGSGAALANLATAKSLTTSTNQPENSEPDHAPGLMEIWRFVKEHDNGITNFHFEISADLLNEEELALIHDMRPGLILREQK